MGRDRCCFFFWCGGGVGVGAGAGGREHGSAAGEGEGEGEGGGRSGSRSVPAGRGGGGEGGAVFWEVAQAEGVGLVFWPRLSLLFFSLSGSGGLGCFAPLLILMVDFVQFLVSSLLSFLSSLLAGLGWTGLFTLESGAGTRWLEKVPDT